MTLKAKHISISIQASPDQVYAFAANPENLPRWAEGLSSGIKKSGDAWVSESPMGTVKVKFAKENTFGVLDHDVSVDSGAVFHNPMRVLKNGTGSEVVFTLYRQPEMTDKAFAEDAARIEADLAQLKSLIEKREN